MGLEAEKRITSLLFLHERSFIEDLVSACSDSMTSHRFFSIGIGVGSILFFRISLFLPGSFLQVLVTDDVR